MIGPDEIRRKAERLYPSFLTAWLDEEPFFPLIVRGRKTLEGGDLAAARAVVTRLRAGSKEVLGYGYTVHWVEVASRTFGRNEFPGQITFDTQDDYLRFVGREREFAAFARGVGCIRSRYPELGAWVRRNRALTLEIAPAAEGLLEVVDCLRANPRPGVFARELPLSVDTKFVERHRRVLREWLDRVLPPETIRADEEHFDRRYGLRYAGPHLLIRFLDPALQREARSPWPELSLPLHAVAALPLRETRVVIVENKVNLLTLPPSSGGVALGGLGNAVTDLRDVPWLQTCEVVYWGDLDVEGFAILSRLRTVLPHVRSLMMDRRTLERWREGLAVRGTGRPAALPPGLTMEEAEAFRICADEDLRLEQERLPQWFVQGEMGPGLISADGDRR